LDTHDKGGSHWVSLFIDLNKKYLFYFDSCGVNSPPKEVRELIKRIKTQCNPMNMKLKTIINHTEHQKGNTECGMYVLYLIICLLEELKTPDDFRKNIIRDKEVEKFRYIYFNIIL
jgi:Ulp1 family protease